MSGNPNSPSLDNPLLILDGGLGTTLEDVHHISLDNNSLWSSNLLLHNPHKLRSVHADFVRNGAQIVLTATYQICLKGVLEVLRNKGSKKARGGDGNWDEGDEEVKGGEDNGGDEDEDVEEELQKEAGRVMRSAVRLARSAFNSPQSTTTPPPSRDTTQPSTTLLSENDTQRRGLVALSLGPYGATLSPPAEFTGLYGTHITYNDLVKFHADRINVFCEDEDMDGHWDGETWAEVDVVAFETVPRVDEVRAVREVMKAKGMGKKFWISCVFPDHDQDDDSDVDEDEDKGLRLPDEGTVQEVVCAMLAPTPTTATSTKNERTTTTSSKPLLPLPRPWGIGINCTPIANLQALVQAYESAVQNLGEEFPSLVLYPNGAGNKIYDSKAQEWVVRRTQSQGPGQKGKETKEGRSWDEKMAEVVEDVKRRGKWKSIVVGGCCKTTPGDIGRLRGRLL